MPCILKELNRQGSIDFNSLTYRQQKGNKVLFEHFFP